MNEQLATEITPNSYYFTGESLQSESIGGISIGVSDEARSVEKQYFAVLRIYKNSEKRKFANDIEVKITEAWREARRINWDGPGSIPVSYKTFTNAKVIASSLPFDFEYTPEVFPDSKGGIVLEWTNSAESLVTVAIRESRIVYSGLFVNGEKESGLLKFKGAFPKKVLSLITDLFQE